MVATVNLITQFLDSVLSEVATAALAGSGRWAAVTAIPGGVVRGVTFGARLADTLGVVGVLALRHDGGFRPALVPVSGPCDVHRQPEADVRRAFVLDVHAPYAPRGHVFRASLVCADLCADCALDELHHRRVAVRLAVEQVLGVRDVVLDFREGTDEVEGVQVRLATRGVSHAPTLASCATRETAWLSLSDAERDEVRQRLRVTGAPLASEALLLACPEHAVAELVACTQAPAHAPYRTLTPEEWFRVGAAVAQVRLGGAGVSA